MENDKQPEESYCINGDGVSLVRGILIVLNWGLPWPYPYLSSEYLHVFLIALGTFFMLLIDFVLWKKGGDRDESSRSRQSFWIADVPVFVAFGVLLVCLLRDTGNEHPDVFFAGAVSFQLVLSNILFIGTEFNLLGMPSEQQQQAEAAAEGRPGIPGTEGKTETPVDPISVTISGNPEVVKQPNSGR